MSGLKRYDRVPDSSGQIPRLHQEDLCQTLSVPPDQKYTADGGPTTKDVLMLLASTDHAQTNLSTFTPMLFFNYLIGAPDAHAKNYALLLGGGGSALIAPLYDVASGLAYERLRRGGRVAMAIGGENRFGRVGAGAVRRYAWASDAEVRQALERVGLSEEVCVERMAKLAQVVPVALAAAFDEAQGIAGVDELRDHLEDHIAQNCRRTLAMLG